MPEMRFRVRWPDGGEESCYSPSLVVRDVFAVGTAYPLPAFVAMIREALTIASDRVKARYGYPCSRALGQLRAIEEKARGFAADPGARVTVVSFEV